MNRETDDKKKEFKEIDPFNPSNTVYGFIYTSNNKYGCLEIHKVNNLPCYQFIYATPKFKYPGNVSSPNVINWENTPDFDSGKVYEKYDGTNMLMFHYKDADGNDFVSYKTRLQPFLIPSAWGDWIKLLDLALNEGNSRFDLEMLKKEFSEFNFGFELYGNMNEHHVLYPDIPLRLSLIYAIDKEGTLYDPSIFPYQYSPSLVSVFDSNSIETIYNEYQNIAEDEFVTNHSLEGYMFYLVKNGKSVCAWKCKSPTILSLQCEGNENALGKNDIISTVINAMEGITSNELTSDYVYEKTIELLHEVYSTEMIERAQTLIREIVQIKTDQIKLRDNVLNLIPEILIQDGIKLVKDNHGLIMRIFASKNVFTKQEMKRVSSILKSLYPQN